jgi:lysozyme
VIIAKIKVMLEAMEAYSGKRPIIYTDPKFHREVLEGEFPQSLFLAALGGGEAE